MPNSFTVNQIRQYLGHQAKLGYVRVGVETLQSGLNPEIILLTQAETNELLQADVMFESERILDENGNVNPAAVDFLVECNALDSVSS